MKPLKFVLIMLLIGACNDYKPATINEKIFGTWYFHDQAGSYIEIDENYYKEYAGGRFNSQLLCKIHWNDSLHFSLEAREMDGVFAKNMKTGQRFDVTINSITPTNFQFSANNTTISVYRNQ